MHLQTTAQLCSALCWVVSQSSVSLSWLGRVVCLLARSNGDCIPRILPESNIEGGGGDNSLGCDRQNLVITLMLLVKQCNCFAVWAPQGKRPIPSGNGQGHGYAAKFALLALRDAKLCQLGEPKISLGLCNISHIRCPSNVLCNSLRH